ncbi:microtubule-associated serine/threonine-protein kinase 3-like [Phyllobates terribilis]|uniref:microtubule-associated serine/threonine-protein kinase 3-like n=1 Tax=Phyllobates terribilis TaxID=111132 RepID=UPI003CCAD1BB
MRPSSDIYKASTEDITSEFLDEETFGTPSYMAPEIIQRKGYGRPVDWWSVGITLHKFLYGCTPFKGALKRDILRSVLEDELIWTYHKYSIPPDARDIITQLLRKDPADRLGTGGANEIKMHPFLHHLDFDNLLSQKPLFVPELKSDEDTRYFITRCSRHMNSDEADTREDNDWPEIKNFVSSYQRFSKLNITNTGMMTNVEPMLPPQCSQENSEKHSDMQKESSSSKTNGDNQCFTAKNSKSSSSSLSESPVQKKRKYFLKLRRQEKTEKVEEGESRRGSIFHRMISSCRRGLSRAARTVRGSFIFACCHQGTLDISGQKTPTSSALKKLQHVHHQCCTCMEGFESCTRGLLTSKKHLLKLKASPRTPKSGEEDQSFCYS